MIMLTLKFASEAHMNEWLRVAVSVRLHRSNQGVRPFDTLDERSGTKHFVFDRIEAGAAHDETYRQCGCGCACSANVFDTKGDLCPECEEPHEDFDDLVAREKREAEKRLEAECQNESD